MSAYERASRHHLPERGPKRSPSRRFRWRWLAPTAVLLLPSPAVYSYMTTMLEPCRSPCGASSGSELITATGLSTRSSTTTTAGRRPRRTACS